MIYDVHLRIDASDIEDLLDKLQDLPNGFTNSELETHPHFESISVSVAGLLKLGFGREAKDNVKPSATPPPIPDIFQAKKPWQGKQGW